MSSRKDISIIKEKQTNLFGRFIVYGLAKIQRDSKYPIACAREYSRNLLSAQHFYLLGVFTVTQSKIKLQITQYRNSRI